MKYFRKKKLGAIAIAGITSVALLATGTFAWQAISQPVTNEIERKINPGARLHDDFNGENKDIYVENFTDPSDGVSVYARIQLREYMEIGTNAGKTGAAAQADKNVEVVGKKDADINDPNTWHIHKNEVNTIEAMEFHDYWSWTMGNEDTSIDKYYMPTFNKDNESLTADVNGTIEGLDGNRHEGDPYDDYVDWKSTSTQSQKEVLNGGVQTENDVEHTAKKLNYHAKIISMKQWKQLPSDQKIGPYWVYDNDGWAYWAQEIAPGETTGLLLNGVQMEKVPENNYYYGIHASGQFATAGDWTGFDGDITQDGKTLLNTISHRLPKVIYMTPKNGSHQFVVPGSSLKLEVDVKVQNATGDPSEKEVEWSINDEALTNTIKGNTFRPTAAMADQTYVLTATSKLTPSVTTSIDVTVLPLGVSIVEGADQKQYVYFGNNVYKRIEEEGRLSNFICAGEDKIIGNDNDINDVYDILSELDTVSEYGRFFLQVGTNRYKAMGPDEMLGTSDDIILASENNAWPDQIGTILANKVEVSIVGEIPQIKIGKSKQFEARVYLGDQLNENQEVVWEISGKSSNDTQISASGLLSVASDEREGGKLTVIAKSKEDPTHAIGSIEVQVVNLGYEDIPDITPESTTTVTIGDNDYYVTAKDGDKALLTAKNHIGSLEINSDNASGQNRTIPWKDWDLRSYLNNDWLNTQTAIIRDNIVETTIYTRDRDQGIVESNDKVFLWSSDDFDSSVDDPRLYTAGKAFDVSSFPSISSWLRGLSTYNNGVAVTYWIDAKTIKISTAGLKSSHYVHPVFWIKMPTNTTTD